MVLSVSERTFTQEVLESSVPVLVNFEAPGVDYAASFTRYYYNFKPNVVMNLSWW